MHSYSSNLWNMQDGTRMPVNTSQRLLTLPRTFEQLVRTAEFASGNSNSSEKQARLSWEPQISRTLTYPVCPSWYKWRAVMSNVMGRHPSETRKMDLNQCFKHTQRKNQESRGFHLARCVLRPPEVTKHLLTETIRTAVEVRSCKNRPFHEWQRVMAKVMRFCWSIWKLNPPVLRIYWKPRYKLMPLYQHSFYGYSIVMCPAQN